MVTTSAEVRKSAGPISFVGVFDVERRFWLFFSHAEIRPEGQHGLHQMDVTSLAVFHGHAHHGSPEGRTSIDIPVYNVSMRLLQRAYPDRPPFRVVEVPLEPQPAR